jgi:hypothetical protein
MVNCTRCQKIIRKEADGTKSERFKCTNGMANTLRQTVSPDDCDHCVLKQAWDCHCANQPPANPIYVQPVFNCDNAICYFNGTPPCPYGYSTRKNPLEFVPLWPACSYLEFANELNEDGSIKIKARCAISQKLIDYQTCINCNGDITSISPKDYPPISTEFVTYVEAVKGWVKEGRPVRTDEEVTEIHQKYCSQCDWYDSDQQRCKGCGCKTRAAGYALLNKIKMGTQHCPKQLW